MKQFCHHEEGSLLKEYKYRNTFLPIMIRYGNVTKLIVFN